MIICSICQSKFENDLCPDCGQSAQVSLTTGGKISAVIRLLLMSICNVAAVVVLFYAMFRESKLSVWAQIVDSVASAALVVFFGVWLWGFVKWVVFAIPKTFRFAKYIFSAIIPLNLFTLVIEFMFCVGITLIPFSLYAATCSPILYVASFVDDNPNNIILPLVLLAVFGFATYFLGKKDFTKVFGARKVAK